MPTNGHGKPDLAAMLADVARREVNELRVEAKTKPAPREEIYVEMYIDRDCINIHEDSIMALQIANAVVVSKVERLAKATGLSKTAAVERAVDRLLSETIGTKGGAKASASMRALLAQLDQIADRADAFDPLAWDEHGLPQ